MSINTSLYFEYSSGMTISLRQSVCSSFWEVYSDNSSSVLIFPTTFGSHYSFWQNFCVASALTLVHISLFRRPSTSCLSNCCCFVEVLVKRMKNGRLEIASRMPFAGRHSRVTRLGSGSKCSRLFALVVTTTGVTKRGSGNFWLATRTEFECFIAELWSSFTSKWVFKSACCVFSFVKNAWADTLCCITMASGVDFRTVTFRLSGRMASMWSSQWWLCLAAHRWPSFPLL